MGVQFVRLRRGTESRNMSDIHVYPTEDWIEHVTTGRECPCEPTVEYLDPDTGLPYPDGAIVLHNAVNPECPGAETN
jgi:hypothetical protein